MIGDLIAKILAFCMVAVALVFFIKPIWEGVTNTYKNYIIRQRYKKLKEELLKLPIAAFHEVVKGEGSAGMSAWETKLIIDKFLSSADEYTLDDIEKRLCTYRHQKEERGDF